MKDGAPGATGKDFTGALWRPPPERGGQNPCQRGSREERTEKLPTCQAWESPLTPWGRSHHQPGAEEPGSV